MSSIILLVLGFLLLLFLIAVPKLRDYFLSGKIYMQFIWLLLILLSTYLLLVQIERLGVIEFQHRHGLLFNFLNSNISGEEKISDKSFNTTEGFNPELIFGFVVGVSGAILTGGLLISVFTNMLERRVERIRQGLVSYSFRRHILFIGYDDIAIGLIKQLEDRQQRKRKFLIRLFTYTDCYLIQTTQDVEQVRKQLRIQLPTSALGKVHITSRNLGSQEDIKALYPHDATDIYLLGEAKSQDHDSENIRILQLLSESRRLSSYSNTPLDCYVMFDHLSTSSIFQNKGLVSNKGDDKKMYINIMSFNFHELWAQKVFVTEDCKKGETTKIFPDLDFKPIGKDSETHVHLVIVGMSDAGMAMATQAMRICHYANFKKRKTRITFIDPQSDDKKNIMFSRYASLMTSVDIYHGYNPTVEKGAMSNYTDIELQFINSKIEDPSCRAYLENLAQDPTKLLTLAICFSRPGKALETGLCLPDLLYEKEANILIYQNNSESPFSSMKKEQEDKYENVYPFGMINDCYDLKLNDDLSPRLISHVYYNKIEYDIEGSPKNTPSIDDLNTEWARMRIVHKWSNKYNADHLPTKLRIIEHYNNIAPGTLSCNCGSPIEKHHLEEMKDLMAQVEHNRWVLEKLLMGYKKADNEDIIRLKTLKDAYYKKTNLYRLEIEKLYSTPKNSDAFIAQQSICNTMSNEISVSWQSIKTEKEKGENKYKHDCLVPFEELNLLDKSSDMAIVLAIPWILNQIERLKPYRK